MFQPWDVPALGCSWFVLNAPVLAFLPQSGMQRFPRDWGKAENEDALLLP